MVIGGMTDETQIIDIVMQWADKCAELRRLDPFRREFAKEVRYRVYEVMQDRIPNMSWSRLQKECPWIYEKLSNT